MVKNWQNAVLLVKPDTVLRWHREGFRLFSHRGSKATKKRQPRISPETVELICDMAVRNKTWEARGVSAWTTSFFLGETHLTAVLEEYAEHFNRARPHQGLQRRMPVPCTKDDSSFGGQVVALPVLGGRHHDYMRAA